jgi:hypothetical protein
MNLKFQNSTDRTFHMPAHKYSSLYAPFWQHIKSYPSANSKPNANPTSTTNQKTSGAGSDPDKFANAIVTQTLKKDVPFCINDGKWWWIIAILLIFPENVIESILAWRFKLVPPLHVTLAAKAKEMEREEEAKKKQALASGVGNKEKEKEKEGKKSQ